MVDPAEAAASTFGRWVLAMLHGGPPFGWAVRSNDLAAPASRLGLDVVEGSRRSRDGALVQWVIAGVAQSAIEPALPFFIQWGPGTPLPGRAVVEHRAGSVALTGLRIEGDRRLIHAWLGTSALPLVVAPGTAGLTGVNLATPTGPIVIDSGQWS